MSSDAEKLTTRTREGQLAVVKLALTDPSFFHNHSDCLKPDIFPDEDLQDIMQVFTEYYEKYDGLPTGATLHELIAKAGGDAGEIFDTYVSTNDLQYWSDEVVEFAKRQNFKSAMNKAIMHYQDSEKMDWQMLMEMFDKAGRVGANSEDLGSIWDDKFVEENLGKSPRQLRHPVETGFPRFDIELDGGLGVKELGIIQGSQKAGKTMVLTAIFLNAVAIGLNAVYYTCEASEQFLMTRIFPFITQMTHREIVENKAKARGIWKIFSEGIGKMVIKEFPKDTATIQDINKHLNSIEATQNWKPDIVIVDYGEIMAVPPGFRDTQGGADTKAKYSALLQLAQKRKIPVWTASQTNFHTDRISGSFQQLAMAHCVAQLRRKGKDPLGTLELTYNRGGPIGTRIELGFNYSLFDTYETGTIEEEEGEDNG